MQRFDVLLRIVHPTADPAAISKTLGLEPTMAWRVGDEKITPTGTLLGGKRDDTRWLFHLRYETAEQWFFQQLYDFIEVLEPQAEFIRDLAATGGEISLEVHLLGDGYFGDTLPAAFIKRLAGLQMGFGLESFVVPQNYEAGEARVALLPRP